MSREIKFRVWDNEKHEWLAESDDDALTYYGFHLVGEVIGNIHEDPELLEGAR